MKTSMAILACGFALAVQAAPGEEKWDLKRIDVSKLPAASDKEGLTYEKDIKPLLKASCFDCHGSKRQKGDLRVDSLDALLEGGESGKSVVPGKSAKSWLLIAAAQIDKETAMPPKRGPGGPRGPRGPGGPNARGGQGGQGGPGGQGGQGGPGDGGADGGPGGPPPGGFGGPDDGPGGPGGPPPGGPDGGFGGPPPGGPDGGFGGPPPGGPDGGFGGPGGPGEGGPGGPGGRGPGGRGPGPQAKPLTPAQVALIRAWIDQGAK